MNKCIKEGCEEERTKGGFCDPHHLEYVNKCKLEKKELVKNRLKDPLYIDDSILFTKCVDTLVPLSNDDEEANDEERYWMHINMHELLFDEYYKQGLSRTELLIKKVKEYHKDCCKLSDGIEDLENELNYYTCYKNFLIKWIKESKIIEKNKLIKELPLITDVTTIVQNIITKL